MSSQGTDYSGSSQTKKRRRTSLYPKKRTPSVSYPRYVTPALKYDGEARITRMASYSFPMTIQGMTISGTNFPAWFMTFSPSDFTIWGSTILYQTSLIPNASEIAALYDRVYIEKVEVMVTAIGTDSATVSAVNTGMPRLFYACDYTDGTGGNSLNQTQQQGSCKFANLSGNMKPLKITLKPMYQRVIYYTAVSSSYEPARGFVASGSGIPHYGLRMALDTSILGPGSIEFAVKFYFRCQNVK